MKLVAENTQADLDRERATADLSWALRELTANLIRITRGAGRAHLIPDQIAEVIHELVAYHDAAGTLPPGAIIEMLQFGQDLPSDGVSEESLDRLAAEEVIVSGALQIAALRLVGQSTQRAAGHNEMYDGIREVERLRAKAAAGRIASQSKPVVGRRRPNGPGRGRRNRRQKALSDASRNALEATSLLTLAEVAGRLRCHPKTLKRKLPELCERNPKLRFRKIGRSIFFTEEDYQMLLEAVAWRPPEPPGAVRIHRMLAQRGRGEQTAQERLTRRLAAQRALKTAVPAADEQ